MKSFALLVAASVFGTTLWADVGGGVFVEPFPTNGDLAVRNIGAESVTPRILIPLGSNTNYKVICQVVYEDMLNPDPSTDDEIKQAESIDKFVNCGIRNFLRLQCRDFDAETLAALYREGYIREVVMQDFIGWLNDYIDALNAKHGLLVDVEVRAVSMRAVGPFTKALAAE